MSWERYLAWALPISAVLGVTAGNLKDSVGVGFAVFGLAVLIAIVIRVTDLADLIGDLIEELFN